MCIKNVYIMTWHYLYKIHFKQLYDRRNLKIKPPFSHLYCNNLSREEHGRLPGHARESTIERQNTWMRAN